MKRGILLAVALTIPLASALVVGGEAWAAKGPSGKEVCTTISGSASGNVSVGGCSGTGGISGSSTPFPATTLEHGGTVTFGSATVTFGAPALATKPGKKCAGYSKTASSNPFIDKFSGAVTGNSPQTLKLPGKYSGEVCVSTSGVISAVKPLKLS
ncbi:MAG TPA: hypothetical protein VMB72_06005 [Acidimicrobiales bacterium]|nr:hypothetical protein [Acidimicrobiales bacterium]